MDRGCADHTIANGTIKLTGLTTVERSTSNGIVLGDGTEIPEVPLPLRVSIHCFLPLSADPTWTRTGYVHMHEMHKELFGDDVIGRTDEDWGLDAEGGCNGSYRPCGFPGVCVISRSLGLSSGVPDSLRAVVVRKRRLFYRTHLLEAAGECSIVEMRNLL